MPSLRPLALAFPLIAALALGAGGASATPTFRLVWQDTGTSSIAVSTTVAQVIVADLVLTLEAGDETRGFGGSFLFDEDLADELDVIGFRETRLRNLVPGSDYGPFIPGPNTFATQESTAGASGAIFGFDTSQLTPGLSIPTLAGPISVTFGTVSFVTNPSRVTTDGTDVRFDILPNGLDGYLLADSVVCTATIPCPASFPGASVNAPEPTTGALLAAGLALGGWAARRRT